MCSVQWHFVQKGGTHTHRHWAKEECRKKIVWIKLIIIWIESISFRFHLKFSFLLCDVAHSSNCLGFCCWLNCSKIFWPSTKFNQFGYNIQLLPIWWIKKNELWLKKKKKKFEMIRLWNEAQPFFKRKKNKIKWNETNQMQKHPKPEKCSQPRDMCVHKTTWNETNSKSVCIPRSHVLVLVHVNVRPPLICTKSAFILLYTALHRNPQPAAEK